MKISYNWLKQYISIDKTPEEMDVILTDIGLEVEGVEKVQSIKGGLEGLIIGEVLEKEKHPNADKLSLTKVNIGSEEPLSIVCGAPNVDAGQKVVVATIGTTIYDGEDSFVIKKSKIRGELSQGMLCAEDELGLGKGHGGIMVLDTATPVGLKASDFFKVETDYIFEIGLTPNRSDAMGHLGVARDLKAYFNVHGGDKKLTLPNLDTYPSIEENLPFTVSVENVSACPRYVGLYIDNIKIAPSPEWLQNRLKSIGLSPINNVVDITNFVLHEYAQPLHAFDASEIKGNKVIVKNLPENSSFTTLDGVERKLHPDDLMICNEEEGMCIAGVFGGEKSGVKESTTSIFLESAYFDAVSIRKASKRHALKTDASFRFERGIDPNITVEAIKRAALLIQEICGGEIKSKIIDIYPEEIKAFDVSYDHQKNNELLGDSIPEKFALKLFSELEIKVVSNDQGKMQLEVPAYRSDVQRQADISEEILRMYGYNTVPIPEKINTSMVYSESPNPEKVREMALNHIAAVGFSEVLNNSLSNANDYKVFKELEATSFVEMLNPLSQELAVMRPTMIMEGLKTIAHNVNRQQKNVKFFELGRSYRKAEDKYIETEMISLWVSGRRHQESWMNNNEPVSFYYIKGIVENLLSRLGLTKIKYVASTNSMYSDGVELKCKKKVIGSIGKVSKEVLSQAGLKQETYYAELDWSAVFQLIKRAKIIYQPVSKFPSSRRDLSILISKEVAFSELVSVAEQADRKLLKEVGLFDVYEGKNLPEGMKSYALYFVLQDEEKTLNDKLIDKVMSKIQQQLESKFNAQLR